MKYCYRALTLLLHRGKVEGEDRDHRTMARLAGTAVWVAMAYLDSGNSRRAAARYSCTGALARHTAEREWWTPIPTLRSCAFRLHLPLTTEPRG